MLSSMSSHSRPTLGICTKWSITEIELKPTSSARAAMARKRLAVSADPPGHVKRPICNPKRNGMGSSDCCLAASGVA